MSKVLCDRADLVAIADAVRYKGGAQGQITLGEMATGVVNIEGGDVDHSVEDSLIDGTVSVYSNDRVTKIGSYAFQYCSQLTSVSFPVCSYIGIYAFCSCSQLTSVSFPVCSYIGSYAFQHCSQLTSVSFPVCSYIGNYAFRNCSQLTSVSFPVCSYIGSYAFCNCSRLTSADFGSDTIPKCSIYASAFASCAKLITLILRYSSLATLSNINAFTKTPISVSTLTGSFGSIYVPASLVNAYKAATNWATYADRITAIVE